MNNARYYFKGCTYTEIMINTAYNAELEYMHSSTPQTCPPVDQECNHCCLPGQLIETLGRAAIQVPHPLFPHCRVSYFAFKLNCTDKMYSC